MNRKIQSYEILETLGHGGMGVVYKARHEFRKETVAIKTLSHQLAFDPAIRQRFRNEAHILNRLDHPNIVKVLDFIEDQESLHLIMEYVEGRTLNTMIGREVGPIVYQRAIPLFRQVLEGVAYAHKNSVVHRDIKPANIMVSPDDVVKVMDFGIAKLTNADTTTRSKMGTLYYMSPEQVQGGKVDERSDIYSLGMTLYEMLAGRLPLERGEHMSDFAIMQQIVSQQLPDPRKFYPHIPEWLVELVNKCLMKNPDNRIRSVEDFLNGLLRYNEPRPDENDQMKIVLPDGNTTPDNLDGNSDSYDNSNSNNNDHDEVIVNAGSNISIKNAVIVIIICFGVTVLCTNFFCKLFIKSTVPAEIQNGYIENNFSSIPAHRNSETQSKKSESETEPEKKNKTEEKPDDKNGKKPNVVMKKYDVINGSSVIFKENRTGSSQRFTDSCLIASRSHLLDTLMDIADVYFRWIAAESGLEFSTVKSELGYALRSKLKADIDGDKYCTENKTSKRLWRFFSFWDLSVAYSYPAARFGTVFCDCISRSKNTMLLRSTDTYAVLKNMSGR